MDIINRKKVGAPSGSFGNISLPIGTVVRRLCGNVIKTEYGFVAYYKYLFKQYYGRSVKRGYHLHHINFDHFDDRIENIQELPRNEHISLHKHNLLPSTIEKLKNLGLRHSKQSSERWSNIMTEKWKSPDFRAKMSEAFKKGQKSRREKNAS